MSDEIREIKLIEIFLKVDDFCLAAERWAKANKIHCSACQGRLTISEILTILIFYQHSGYKCFQYYYESGILGHWSSCFPKAVAYHRFLDFIPRCFNHLFVLAHVQCAEAARTGTYFADSKKLPVCDNRRIGSNWVFKEVAKRGKSSTGWFYGLKLHLIINNLGEVVNFLITPANVADNNEKVLLQLFEGVQGECYADKGYLSKLMGMLFQKGLHLITKVRKNMKNQLMKLHQRLWLVKRAVIESVNDLLMSVFDIDHTRHRSPLNAMCHILAGLVAYGFYDDKPSVILPNLIN